MRQQIGHSSQTFSCIFSVLRTFYESCVLTMLLMNSRQNVLENTWISLKSLR